MEALIPMLKNVLIFVALAIPGYILVKSGSLKDSHSGVLSKLLMYVGLPFLILSGTLGVSFDEETVTSVVIVALLGTAITFLFFFLSSLITKYEPDGKKRGMLRFCEIFSNNGFLGLPIAAAVFGQSSLVFTYLVILNIITNTLLYTLGIYLVSNDKSTIKLNNVLLNPVLIAFVLGVILNLLGVTKAVPEITSYSDHFKGIVTPISMTILGMKMGGIRLGLIFSSKRTYLVSAIKLVAVPIIATIILIAINAIFSVGRDMVIATFVAFAMPVAGLASAFADRYSGDTEGAVVYTLGSTLFSVVTIPLLYGLVCLVI